MNDLLSSFPQLNEQTIKMILYIVVLLFLFSLLRSLFRMAMPVIVLGLVMVVFLGFSPAEVINKGIDLFADGKNHLMNDVFPYFNEQKEPHEDLLEKDPKENIEKPNEKLEEEREKKEWNTF